jgi:hypothetical protein
VEQKRQSDQVTTRSGSRIGYHRVYRMPPLGLTYLLALVSEDRSHQLTSAVEPRTARARCGVAGSLRVSRHAAARRAIASARTSSDSV